MSFVLVMLCVFAGFVASQEPYPGEPFEIDRFNKEVKSLLHKAIEEQNSVEAGVESMIVKGVLKATGQVIPYQKTIIEFLTEGTFSSQKYQCHIVLFGQPWKNNQSEMKNYSCTPYLNRDLYLVV